MPNAAIRRALPAWCEGNRAEPLIHGSTYFDHLAREVEALRAGDHVFFTDWRGDPDQKMRDNGPTVRELFCHAAQRGVVVKGLVWRSHLDKFAYSEEENRHLGEAIERAGGEVLLDQRVRIGGSHHQKLVVIRHPGAPERTSRSPAASTCAIPAATTPRTAATHKRCRWPSSTASIRRGMTYNCGYRALRWAPSIRHFASAGTTRRHWTCCRRSHGFRTNCVGADLTPDPLPEQPPDPPPCGPHAIQVLRTYPDAHFEYDFAPHGERSIARAYNKVVPRARKLIYVEDQYLWSKRVAQLFAQALAGQPGSASGRNHSATPRRRRPAGSAAQQDWP